MKSDLSHGNDDIIWRYVILPILTFGLWMPKELDDEDDI